MTDTAPVRFGFAFAQPFGPLLALFGIRPSTTWVTADRTGLGVRFGPWRLYSPRGNIVGVTRTGPYRWWRAIGPRLSLADRGATFGTTVTGGVCIRFATPVSGLVPGRWLRHSAVTVTVADPDGLIDYLGVPS